MKVRGGKGRFRWWAGGGYSRRVADEAPLCLPAGRPLASSWKPRPAVTTRRSQRTPVLANVASCTKSGLLHQSVHQYRQMACTSVHQCGPQAAAKPTRQWAAPPGGSQRRPAGETLDYACVPPIYALPVSWLFNLKMQKSPLLQCTSDTIDTLFCNGWV